MVDEYTSSTFLNPLFDHLAEWIQSAGLKANDMGRFIAIVLALIAMSYVLLFVVRILVAITWPTLVVVGFLLILRLITFMEVAEGFKELNGVVNFSLVLIRDLLRESIVNSLDDNVAKTSVQ
ncbi:uncharacterized protein Dana_GF18536 [Drosophila ananassae]|uniref:Uncharacterized protein n=1 Tax=Drosophila ananassae TaxID=7217 RepID=B3M2Z7_DROAN|nr:uncharacterized protein LOC6501309 [Drosophila ananassae]EDV43527.1 uncharacterized protein Dana_GF18536 [Drosophila ananassae]